MVRINENSCYLFGQPDEKDWDYLNDYPGEQP